MNPSYEVPSSIHASQLDPEEAERLMQQSELFTEMSEVDQEMDPNMYASHSYNLHTDGQMNTTQNMQPGAPSAEIPSYADQ